MNKFKQCVYTLLLIATCFIASPLMFHQIWKNSAEAKKKEEPLAPPAVSSSESVPGGAEEQPATGSVDGSPVPEPAEKPDSSESGQPEEQQPEKYKSKMPDIYMQSDKSYFDDALFIGDSRTVGLMEYGTLDNAEYFCDTGISAYQINEALVNGMTFDEAIDAKQYGKIYIMLGINEVGNDFEYTLTAYRAIVEKIKVHQPDALIYVQANLHVSSFAETGTINNERINYLNDSISSLADYKRVFYIDVNELYDDESGCLNAGYTEDGIHPLGMYYQQWCEWLCTKTIPTDGRYYEVTDSEDIRYYTDPQAADPGDGAEIPQQ